MDAEPQVLVVPLMILIGLLAPLYALVAGLYVLLFKHSENDDRHFNKDNCEESKGQIRGYIKDVDIRSAKAVDDLKRDINLQFNRLFAELAKK